VSDIVFLLSKLLHVLLEPDSLLILLLCLGAALMWRWIRLGRWIVSVATALLVLISVLPLGQWLLMPLENRFPQPVIESMPAPDGIIVLGGAIQTSIAGARGTLALNEYAERIAQLVIFAHRYPQARLVYSGGSADIRRERPTESAGLAPYLAPLGLEPARVALESSSRNTYENAVETRRLIQPNPGERWLLVTSAAHMPRSVGVFRGVGWDVIPYAVDYHTSGRERWPSLAPAPNWQQLRFAAHEYIGLLSYYLAGYSQTLFPGPQEKTL
jgi:uncharacterized SAM-binding protein YcdF (DUF218 family)